MSNSAQTYPSDVVLLNKLGFKLFDIPLRVKHYLGEHTYDDGATVKLWVECWPAQFWTAKIYCAETKSNYELRAGSGSLQTFWQSFELVAQGALVINIADHNQDAPNKLTNEI